MKISENEMKINSSLHYLSNKVSNKAVLRSTEATEDGCSKGWVEHLKGGSTVFGNVHELRTSSQTDTWGSDTLRNMNTQRSLMNFCC